MMIFPIWAKTYGGPKDDFVRVFDTYTLVPAGLAPDGVPLYDVKVLRKVVARGYVNQLDVTLGFVRDPGAAPRGVARVVCRQGDGNVSDMMMPDAWYLSLDVGIRFAVRVLHASGHVETCQSCEGGPGHAYDHPSIDLLASGSDANGFAALAALTAYGVEVAEVSLVWPVRHGLPYEKIWRIVLVRAIPERANDRTMFVSESRVVEPSAPAA